MEAADSHTRGDSRWYNVSPRENAPSSFLFSPLRMSEVGVVCGTRVFDRYARTLIRIADGYVVCSHRPVKRTRVNNGVAVAQCLIVARGEYARPSRREGERWTFFTRDFVRESPRLIRVYGGEEKLLKFLVTSIVKLNWDAILSFERKGLFEKN